MPTKTKKKTGGKGTRRSPSKRSRSKSPSRRAKTPPLHLRTRSRSRPRNEPAAAPAKKTSSKRKKTSKKRKGKALAKNQVLREWRELLAAVQRDFLEMRAPAAQLSQALQLACPKALQDADVADTQFQKKAVTQTVPEHYYGYRMPWPLTEAALHGLLRAVKTKPSVPLHEKYVANILVAAKQMFQNLSRVTDIQITSRQHKKLIVVGNLNGQLADLLTIWQKHGLPHPEGTQYLFNGGVVNHGEHGMEVLLLLLVFKLFYPDSVHINRGWPEDGNANRFFGFFEEVRKKCGGPRIFSLFQNLFACLPVASVVDRSVLVVHGGLSRHTGVLLEHLRGIPMVHELPNNPTTFEEELLHDIMWSKPRKQPGVGNAHGGGAGAIEFGPDVTEHFLRANGLNYIIRSLTVPQNLKGYSTTHKKKMWTLFSASNFCGHAGNYGAVIEFSPDHKTTVHSHWAPGLSSFGYGRVVMGLEVDVKRLMVEVRKEASMDVIRQIQLRVALHRQDLYYHFSRLDKGATGTIGLKEWCQGMTAVLKLALPWEKYLAELLPAETPYSEDAIEYVAFCEYFPIEIGEAYGKWQEIVQNRIHKQVLALNPSQIQNARDVVVRSGGRVTEEELERLISSPQMGVTGRQLQEYMRGLGRPKSDRLDICKFLRTLEVIQNINMQPEVYDALQILSVALHQRNHSPKDVFRSYDSYHAGTLGYTPFVNAMHQLQSLAGVHFSDDVLRHIGMALYNTTTATVDYLEVVDAMNMSRYAQESKIVQHICNTLVKYNSLFTKAFHILDYTGVGHLAVEEVMVGLLAVNTLLMAPDKLSDEDIDAIATNVSTGGDRRIDYEQFMSSFLLDGHTAYKLYSCTNPNCYSAARISGDDATSVDDSAEEDAATTEDDDSPIVLYNGAAPGVRDESPIVIYTHDPSISPRDPYYQDYPRPPQPQPSAYHYPAPPPHAFQGYAGGPSPIILQNTHTPAYPAPYGHAHAHPTPVYPHAPMQQIADPALGRYSPVSPAITHGSNDYSSGRAWPCDCDAPAAHALSQASQDSPGPASRFRSNDSPSPKLHGPGSSPTSPQSQASRASPGPMLGSAVNRNPVVKVEDTPDAVVVYEEPPGSPKPGNTSPIVVSTSGSPSRHVVSYDPTYPPTPPPGSKTPDSHEATTLVVGEPRVVEETVVYKIQYVTPDGQCIREDVTNGEGYADAWQQRGTSLSPSNRHSPHGHSPGHGPDVVYAGEREITVVHNDPSPTRRRPSRSPERVSAPATEPLEVQVQPNAVILRPRSPQRQDPPVESGETYVVDGKAVVVHKSPERARAASPVRDVVQVSMGDDAVVVREGPGPVRAPARPVAGAPDVFQVDQQLVLVHPDRERAAPDGVHVSVQSDAVVVREHGSPVPRPLAAAPQSPVSPPLGAGGADVFLVDEKMVFVNKDSGGVNVVPHAGARRSLEATLRGASPPPGSVAVVERSDAVVVREGPAQRRPPVISAFKYRDDTSRLSDGASPAQRPFSPVTVSEQRDAVVIREDPRALSPGGRRQTFETRDAVVLREGPGGAAPRSRSPLGRDADVFLVDEKTVVVHKDRSIDVRPKAKTPQEVLMDQVLHVGDEPRAYPVSAVRYRSPEDSAAYLLGASDLDIDMSDVTQSTSPITHSTLALLERTTQGLANQYQLERYDSSSAMSRNTGYTTPSEHRSVVW